MSKIDEMINELCPDGVEKVKLGDVCDVLRGARLTKAQISDIESVESPYPVLHGGLSPMGFYKEPNRKAGTTIVVNTGNAGSVYYSENDFWSSDACFSLYPHEGLIDKYLYYYLYGMEYILKGRIRAGAMPTIDSLAVETLQIPLPPLSIQQKIVSVLDSFTTLIDKMKQEVEKRKKQMEYYREKLLTFEDGECEWKKLEELTANDCTISYGIVQPGDGVQEGVPVVRPVDMVSSITYNYKLKNTTKEISDSYSKTILKGGELLVCVRGTTGIVSVAADDLKGCNVTRGIVPLWFDNRVISKYMYFSFTSDKIQDDIENNTNGAGLRQINIKDLKHIKFPIPPLFKQREIVSTLDKFESYITKLEKMILLRQKQYEYYREQLLTFI